jgi:hypothetical protein
MELRADSLQRGVESTSAQADDAASAQASGPIEQEPEGGPLHPHRVIAMLQNSRLFK